MSRFLTERLSALIPYTPGEQPKDMDKLLKLNTNENPYPPAPGVAELLTMGEADALRLYPDPDCGRFVRAAADYNGVRTENVFPGNGSDEVLAFCFLGLCPGGAAFPDITYGFYSVCAGLYGVETTIVPLREDYTINVEDYSGLRGTVFLANPNAPTGISLPLPEIEKLLCQDRDRLVVVDEAYVEFGGCTALPLLERYDNLLIVRTLSKSHSLAGARLGYALGSAGLISDLNRMRFSFNPYNINRLSLLAGAAALKDTDYFSQCRDRIIESREYTASGLRNLGFKVLDSSANFVFAGDNPKITGREYYRRLRETGTLVRHFDGPRTENYVRITIGTQPQMERLVAVTGMILGGGI
ncbi:MAG: histidinol-phosphate transaminase [Oscillospiraceae bacterium]|jgi:histidinol-phosphate aminotransferase